MENIETNNVAEELVENTIDEATKETFAERHPFIVAGLRGFGEGILIGTGIYAVYVLGKFAAKGIRAGKAYIATKKEAKAEASTIDEEANE